jgi:hypothetical protein
MAETSAVMRLRSKAVAHGGASVIPSTPDFKTRIGLPPKHLDQGLDGLLEDMLSLALFSRMQDGRINMPDVYRVGFGLGRKGGVKPIG